MKILNKKIPTFWLVVTIVVLTVGVATLILGVIPMKNAPALTSSNDLIGVELHTNGTNQLYLSRTDESTSARFDTLARAYNRTRSFTVLRGLLVGQLQGMRLTADEEDGDRYDFSEIKALGSNSSQHMLVFRYTALQTLTIRGEKFEFNEAKVLVSDTNNEIGVFTIALYDTNAEFNAPHGPGVEGYSIRLIRARGKCTILYNAINDLVNPA